MSRKVQANPARSAPTAEDKANLGALVKGQEYAMCYGPDDECGLDWTEDETRRTGRSPWDVLDEPGGEYPISYRDLYSVDGEWEFSTYPYAVFLEECQIDASPANPTGDETRTAEQWESELKRIWHRLWIQDSIFPSIADVLMVLIVETELLVRPRYTTEQSKDEVQREFEWEGVTDLHQHANRLWTRILRGASATVVEAEYDTLCNKYPVLPYLAVCQKSRLLYLLERRDHLIKHAKVAETRWQLIELRIHTSHQDELSTTVTPARDAVEEKDVVLGKAESATVLEVGSLQYEREEKAILAATLLVDSRRLQHIDQLRAEHFNSGGWKAVQKAAVQDWNDAGLNAEDMPKYLSDPAAMARAMSGFWRRKSRGRSKDAE